MLRYFEIEDSDISESDADGDNQSKRTSKVEGTQEAEKGPGFEMQKLPIAGTLSPNQAAVADARSAPKPATEAPPQYGDDSTPKRARHNLLYYICYLT
mgnify:FL=1